MGKSKQAQRTKGNARPSNSSRSAQLLDTATPNFIGFSAVKDGGYVPVLPGLSSYNINEINMSNVDANFQMVLKKMNKKDATTKCKALQEFAAMCEDLELSAVKSMLPFWPRLYCVLAIDIEHRVRESAQLAHAALVKRVGKGIAMYLKQLAGTWFVSQHDTYPPAASAATNSFNETFPQKKVIDAIIYCQCEILTYISDNITVHTAQTLSQQKCLTAEEMEAKYQRLLIAILQGYSYYLNIIPIEEIKKMADIHRKIISNNKFWRLVKHDALPVKTAFFNVLASLIKYADVLLQDEKKRTVVTIMNSLDETEPGLLSTVWESMLMAVNKIEDWYTLVNIEKLVLPKLWSILRNGGQCCASVVYPNLLPFVSQFPKFNANVHNLYINFFTNMRQGFLVKSVQMSRSEMFAVTTSFVECLRYSILLNVNNEDLCDTLLKEQLMPLLETCFKENAPMKHILFCEVTHLVRYWSKNRNNQEYKSYSYLIQEFWDRLDKLFDTLINPSHDSMFTDASDNRNSQIEFLIALKNAPGHSRKNLKVKFSSPMEETKSQSETKSIEIDTDNVFSDELNNFVSSLCITYFNKIIVNHTKQYIIHLNKLLTSFEDEKFFLIFSKCLRTEVNFSQFCSKIVQNWILEKSDETEHIIELIFILIKYMKDNEKDEVLELLTRVNDIAITRCVIQCALCKNSRNDTIIKKWCSQSKIINLLIDVAKEIASGNYNDLEKNQNLLLLAFETSIDKELLINEKGANDIISTLRDSFNRMDETSLLHFTKLISCIAPLTWLYKERTSAAIHVLEMLFELCCQEYVSNNGVLINSMREVWKQGVLKAISMLSQSEFIDLTKKFATVMWKKIYDTNDEHINDILFNIATDFLEVIINNDLENSYAKKIIFTFLTETNIKIWIAETTRIVMYGEVVTGKLYVSTLDQKIEIFHDCVSIDLTNDTVTDKTSNCLKWALFNTNLFKNIYLGLCNEEDLEDLEVNSEVSTIPYFTFPGMADILMNILYSIILGQLYSNHYKSTKQYNNVNTFLMSTRSSFKQLQTFFTEDIYCEIRNYMTVNFSKYGSMSPYIVHFYCTQLYSNGSPEKVFESVNSTDELIKNDEMHIQGLQIMPEYIKLENLAMNNDISAIIITRSMLTGKYGNETYSDILAKVLCYEKQDSSLLLFDCDISEVSWEKLTLPLEIIRLLTEFVKQAPTALKEEHWNFILISLVFWELSLIKSKHNNNDFKVIILTIAVCQLYREVQNVMYNHEQNQMNGLPPNLLDEWKNVFATDVQSGIINTWMSYADSYNTKTLTLKSVIVLDQLGKAVKLLDGNVIFKEQSSKLVTVPTDLDDATKLSLKLLQSPIASVQLGAYHVLKHTVSILVERDTVLIESDNFDANNLNIKRMEDILQSTQTIVDAILMDFKLCDTVSCTIELYTDSYTYTLGYLLTWAIILDMCAKAGGDLRYQYAEILKNNFFPCLLNNIFRLMPVEVLQDNKNKDPKLMEIFSTVPCLDFGESWTEWRLDHIVCWLYTNSLRHLPVLVRQWWSTADSRVSAAVDKITTHYVSPMLCQEELFNTRLANIENMQIKVHPTAREVVALYQMDDTKLELSIVLPPNHPLGSVTVDPGLHAGGTANWRNYHMQMSIFLTHQNGSVWDGLALWKRNLDKKFAGIEECYICFSIFHISTHQIPKFSCHTCRKKFHAPCLYKWFSTSQKSTCPICRNVF